MPLPRKNLLTAIVAVITLCALHIPSPSASEPALNGPIERFRQALEIDPNNPTLHYLLGLEQLKSDDATAAISSFRAAYPAYTGSIEMNYNLGLAFLQTGDADSGLLYLDQAEALGALKTPEATQLINAYYKAGLIYLEQESLPAAAALFRRVLVLDPDRVEIMRLLGDIAARLGETDEAIRAFGDYLQHYPDDQSAREYLYALHFNRGLKQMEEADDTGARASFEAARKVSPDSPLIFYYLGYIAYRAGDGATAIDNLARAYASIPDELTESTRSMLYNCTLKALEEKKLELALSGIAPLIASADARGKDLLLAGNIHLQRQEYLAAADLFRRVLQIEPTQPQALINLAVAEEKGVDELFEKGLAAYKREAYPEALGYFDQALTLQPVEHRSSGYRAKTLKKIDARVQQTFSKGRKALVGQDYVAAAAAANAGLQLRPDDAEGLRLRHEALKGLEADVRQLIDGGLELLQANDFGGAEAQFDKVMTIDPDNGEARKGLEQSRQKRRSLALQEVGAANTALDEGRLEDAAARFRQAEQLMPDLPETLEGRARLEALTTSLVAQELQWGRRARSAGELDQAVAHFDNALKLSDTPEIRTERDQVVQARRAAAEDLLKAARLARDRQDFKTARDIYARILDINPQHPAAAELQALNNRIADDLSARLAAARDKLTQQQYRAALDGFRHVLDLDPENREALHGLQQARDRIRTAITGQLDSARTRFEQGDLDAAVTAYRQVLQLDPYQSDAKTGLTRIAALQQTGIRPGDENRLYLQGIEFYTQGKYAEAISAWEKVLQLSPEHTKAKMNIEKAKRKLQSIQEFKRG